MGEWREKSKSIVTRHDMESVLTDLCQPLATRFSPGKAYVDLGSSGARHPRFVAGIEGFSRILWGLVPLWVGGGHTLLDDSILEGIRHGTAPTDPEYWGVAGPFDQRLVEMAALGLGLALTPDRMWDSFTASEQHNFATWLNQINRQPLPDNNWRFFQVLVNVGLRQVGAPYDAVALYRALELLDTMYLSGGWYADGISGPRDYYIAFGMHFYGLVYSKLMGRDDASRAATYRQRAKEFASDFIHWFSDDGSAVPFGRSLSYRFAQCAFWGAMAFAEIPDGFSTGVIKGLILRHLRWWFQQEIVGSDGLLTIGYAYQNGLISEEYISPSSPYWAFKAFLPLALGEEHPFWTQAEEAMPELPSVATQVHPQVVIQREAGHVVALVAGKYMNHQILHAGEKYSKFAYSTAFGFSVPRGSFGLSDGAFDSMLVVSPESHAYRGRYSCEKSSVQGDVVYSKWLPWDGVAVETWIVPIAEWHVRVHRIVTLRALDTAEGGFAIARSDDEYGTDVVHATDRSIIMLNGRNLVSGLHNACGLRWPKPINCQPNTNIVAARTAIPMLVGHVPAGDHWYVTAVFAGVDITEPERKFEKVPMFRSESGNRLRIILNGKEQIIELSATLNLS